MTAGPAPVAGEVAALSARNAELAALNRVAEAAGSAPDLDLFLARAGEEVANLHGAAVVGFFLLERDRRQAVLLYLHGGDDEVRRRLASAPLAGNVFEAVGLGGQVRVRQVPDLPAPLQALLAPLHLATVASAPARFRSTVVGVLSIGYREPRAPEACRTDLLEALGAHFAAAVETHRLLGDLRGRVAELTLLNDVAVATATLDPVLLLENALRRTSATFRAEAAAAYVLEAGELRQTACLGVSPETAARAARVELGRGPAGQAAAQGKTIHFAEPRPVNADQAWVREREGLRVGVGVPLLAKDRVLGAFVLGRRRPEPFTDAELSLLTAVGVQLGVAVENARLFADTRRRAAELSLVNEVGRSLVATLELDQVLEAGVRNLARIVEAPDAYLLLADERRDRMVVRAASGSGAHLVGHTISLRLQRSLSSLVYERRTPAAVEDVVHDDRVDAALQALTGGRAYLGLPLVVRERSIGVALIAETRAPRRFTPAEVERGAAIANQLAVAVENARLYEDLRRSYADLARAQDQLVRQERLAALGELAAVVAHEVRNPLGVVFNSLGSLRRLVPQRGDARMLLDVVGEEAERLNRMVGDLLDFARPSRPTLRPEPLAPVIDDALAAALTEGGRAVHIDREVAADLPPVPMDARLLRQAILNLVINAAQAMGDSGTLTVRARAEEESAVLEIGDTGPGIPEDVRHRIFEPFFTTKATGTGLGLAVVKRIVDDHHGRIATRPGPQGGTIFSVRLPVRLPSPLKPGARSAEDEP